MPDKLGISIAWQDPLYKSNLGAGSFVNELTGYSHNLGIDWLYLDATINLLLPLSETEDWVVNGLGRDIKVKDQSGNTVFRGFVNQVDVQSGALSFTYGPLTDVGNRVLATYSPLLILSNFIAQPGQTETIFVENATSQELFGIWEKIIQVGNCYVNPETDYNQAEDLRDQFLLENAYPKKPQTISLGSQEPATMTLTIKGYHEWLKAYYYQNRQYQGAVLTTIPLYTKVINALNSEPNGIISTDQSQISTSLTGITVDQENNYKTAYEVVQSVINAGENGAPITFYIDEDLRPVLKVIDTSFVGYSFSISDEIQTVRKLQNGEVGAEVQPWNVKPGIGIVLTDWLLGDYGYPGSIYSEDPRVSLIKSVNFTAPYGLSFDSDKMGRFERYINYKGSGTL